MNKGFSIMMECTPKFGHCHSVCTLFKLDRYHYFLFLFYSTLLLNTVSHSTVLKDAGIEFRTVATAAFAVRYSNHSVRSRTHSARSYSHSARYHPPTRLDLIHQLSQISSTHSARTHPPTRLDLIHKLG